MPYRQNYILNNVQAKTKIVNLLSNSNNNLTTQQYIIW